MKNKNIKEVLNGKKALQVILKETYQVDVSDEMLDAALFELGKVAARNTNASEKDPKAFGIFKFNLFNFKFSLRDGLRIKTNDEVSYFYPVSADEVGECELEGLRELHKIVSFFNRSNEEVANYCMLNGIRVARGR